MYPVNSDRFSFLLAKDPVMLERRREVMEELVRVARGEIPQR